MGAEYTIRAEREIEGLDVLVNGKALAHSEELGQFAERAGVAPLLSFFSQDPEEARAFAEEHDVTPPPGGYPPIQWFEAADGLATVQALIAMLEADPSIAPGASPSQETAPGDSEAYRPWTPDAEELISDLHEFEDVLDQLDDAGVRWHLSVDY